MHLSRRALMGSSLALLASCATQTPPPATRPKAEIGAWGIDTEARDLAVRPGDDFYRHANGGWLRTAQIPADRTSWGTFQILQEKSERDAKAIIEETAAAPGPRSGNAQKIADFYTAFVDQDALDAKGLAPIADDLAAIAALRTHEQTMRLIARPNMPVNTPIAFYIGNDSKNPDRYLVYITHAGLGLGERQYYLNDGDVYSDIRTRYLAHIERMLTLAEQPEAGAKARQIMALETAIAQRHWPAERRRDVNATYNPKTRAELAALYRRYPWDAMFEGAELDGVENVVVAELDAMAPLARLFMATPVSTWRAYLTFHYLSQCSAVLPRAFDEEDFAFFGRVMTGQPEQRARDKRGVDAVNEALGEAVGEIYVQRHFPPAAKQQMLTLVENLRKAYGERIDALDWMSPETKVAAREKLALFRPKVGYPDKWRDYTALDVRAGDAHGNMIRANEFDWRRKVARLNDPADRDEWLMTPQTVNAYYMASYNEICFPAAILQAPFFDPNADDAVNYGGIGGVIGHEMGHGFDDQGSQFDGRGVLRTWWSEDDLRRFSERTASLKTQYSAYEALPGLFVNGQLTLGENIGDNGGLQVAYYAYRMSLAGAEAPVLDGFSGDQRFFLSWAQVWRQLMRDERMRNRVLTAPHSPPEFRCNGVVRNMDAWYAAFNVAEMDKLYLPPDQRVLIW